MKKECSAGYDCDACKPEMSLRDWFAGMAMNAVIIGTHNALSTEEAALAAYMHADAMIRERDAK